MAQIYPAVRESDVVVLASPLYYWNMSGQLRTAVDRLFALEEGDGNLLRGHDPVSYTHLDVYKRQVQVWKDRSKTSYVCGQMIGSNDRIYGILLDSGEYIDVPEHQLKKFNGER